MDFKDFLKPKKKEKIVSVRVTKKDFYLMKQKKVSPSRLFDLALKEWNISPERPPQSHLLDQELDYQQASKAGKLTNPQKLIITKMKLEAIKPKMSFNIGTLLIIGAVAIGGYYALTSMGVIQ